MPPYSGIRLQFERLDFIRPRQAPPEPLDVATRGNVKVLSGEAWAASLLSSLSDDSVRFAGAIHCRPLMCATSLDAMDIVEISGPLTCLALFPGTNHHQI